MFTRKTKRTYTGEYGLGRERRKLLETIDDYTSRPENNHI